jgi:hypothetical protein
MVLGGFGGFACFGGFGGFPLYSERAFHYFL